MFVVLGWDLLNDEDILLAAVSKLVLEHGFPNVSPGLDQYLLQENKRFDHLARGC